MVQRLAPRRRERRDALRRLPLRGVSAWVAPAALALAATGPLSAAAQPDDAEPERVREAAAEFDLGLNAFDNRDFAVAAEHFEAADAALPSAEALRAAMTAWDKAEAAERAATLAAQAKRRYPGNAKLGKVAADVLQRRAGALHRVEVTCAKPCVVTVAGQAVGGPAALEGLVYVRPGKTTIGARFVGREDADSQVITARAGGSNSLHFTLPSTSPGGPTPEPEAGVGHAPSETPAEATETGDETEGEGLGDEGAEGNEEPSDEEFRGWSPAVFVVGLGVTAVLGGVTIWSGVDTLNNPGTETVREACRGLGEDCPEYQQGLDSQLRTNVLIGVTAGVGALTGIVGLLLTDWGGKDEDDATETVTFAPATDGLVGVSARF